MRTKKIIQLIVAFGILTSGTSFAQGPNTAELEEGAIGRTPPRLSATWGEVSFWRPGAQEWSEAQVNIPLAAGDLLYTGPKGNLEIQIGARAFVRGGPNTQLGLENQEPDFIQFKVTAGSASFDLRSVEPGRTVEVDTPNAVFIIEHAGYYRADVGARSTSFITRRGGQATASYPGGEALAIEPSEDVVIEGTENSRVASYAAPRLDEWDRWNYTRTDRLLDAVSARYASPGIYGVDDLDVYGTWRIVPDYGAVWVPRGVPSGWAPYSTGAWVHDPYYGWTWVDTAPWGWAPYHYGRWVFVNGFWAWAPGPAVARPVYAPALVAFLGGPSAGIGVSVGIGPVVGWVALGWGEPCVPWWGPERFRHRPWWGGWGGPRVVDNVVIRSTTVVNVQEIKVYRNASVRNAVVVIKEDHFGRGLITSARVTKVEVRDFRPIHNGPPVIPTPAGFVPREKRGIQPPEKILERSVVATRQPQVRAEKVPETARGAGPERLPAPAPRIVSPPQRHEVAPELRRAPYGQKGAERSTEQTRPAAPPRMERPQPERAPQGPATATQGAQAPRREAQPARPPGAERQAPVPGGRAESGRAQTAAPQRMEGPRGPEQVPKGAPSVAPRQVAPHQSGQHMAKPSPAPESRTPRREGESAQPPSRALPGEPANRISPDRYERRPQQRMEKRQEPGPSAPSSGREEEMSKGRGRPAD